MTTENMPEKQQLIETKSIPVTESGCWLWLGSKMPRGYGQIQFLGKKYYAHRLSFEAYKGHIPDGHVVRHTCDEPSCVNPDHLLSGTQKDNTQDCIRRNRFPNGEKNGATRYSDELVQYIRNSSKGNGDLARELGMDKKYVWELRGGRKGLRQL